MKKTKLSLEERLKLGWHEWNDAIAGLTSADFERMVYQKWNLKDVMGHVFAYLDLALRHVQSYKKRKRLYSPRARSYSFFNRREAERLKTVPLAQLRRDLKTTYRELLTLVPTLNHDDLKKPFPAQWANSTYKTTLRHQLRETAGHMQNHADEVKAWRQSHRL